MLHQYLYGSYFILEGIDNARREKPSVFFLSSSRGGRRQVARYYAGWKYIVFEA
jgi:hypothetical protein